MLTPHRDLRTGTPVWHRSEGPLERLPRLQTDVVADVVVVGGGVTGALVADALARTGRAITAVDRRGWAVGSTAASTALLQFEIDRPLVHLEKQIGRDAAVRAYTRSANAVDYLRGRIADLGLRCALRERHAAYLPGNVLDVAGLRAECAARAAIGLRSEMIGRADLRAAAHVDRPAAIWSGGCAEVDPVALCRGLWRSLVARGAKLFAPVEVRAVHPGRRGVTLDTVQGYQLHARDALIARKSRALERRLGRMMPGVDATPTHAWAGCFGESATGLPTIGRIPRARGCHLVRGFGGNGITFAAVAAQLLMRTLNGLSDPDEDLFAV